MYKTVLATLAGSMRGSCRNWPSACKAPVCIWPDISLTTLPTSTRRNPKCATVQQDGLREPGQGMFGRHIGGGMRAWTLRRDRAIGDNAAALRRLSLHDAHRLARAKQGAYHIDLDNGAQIGNRRVLQRQDRGIQPGIVEEDIDASEPGKRRFKQSRNRCLVGDVGGHTQPFAMPASQVDRFAQGLFTPSGHNDTVACGTESQGCSPANTAAGTCNNSDLHGSTM